MNTPYCEECDKYHIHVTDEDPNGGDGEDD